MATDDRRPLILEPDDDDNDSLHSARRRLPHSNSTGASTDSGGGDARRITVSASPSFATLAESDIIAAIFVVAFDTRTGLFAFSCRCTCYIT